MVVKIIDERQGITASMEAGDTIQVYVNGAPVAKTLHVVEAGNEASATFQYNETKLP